MIFYSDKNVYEAALERFRYIFREFYGKRKIVVTMSGGKDSTVVLNLAHEVMKEMGIEKASRPLPRPRGRDSNDYRVHTIHHALAVG